MSTGLVPVASFPTDEHKVRQLQQELYERNRQLNEIDAALAKEKAKNTAIERGVQELRAVLGPLYSALKHIHGEIDAMGVGTTPSDTNSRTSAIWEDWKAKFPGYGAKAIDALLLHGSMTQTQLRIAIGSRSSGTMTNVVSALNRAGIIVKADGKIRLKEL
jgi:chromosome segregation ATPase